MKMRAFFKPLLVLATAATLAACGSSGGDSDRDTAGGSAITGGVAVDPYIAGAVFQEVTTDGRVLQRESTMTDELGRFTFPRPVQPDSIIEMKVGSRGTHNGLPYQGLLKRRADADDAGPLVVSPLTTLLANGVAPEELLSFLGEAGLTGMTAADLEQDPMAGLENLRPGEVAAEQLRCLQAAMAVNTFLHLLNDYAAGSGTLAAPANRQMMTDLVEATQIVLNPIRFKELAAVMGADPEMTQPMLFGDMIRLGVDAMQQVERLRDTGGPLRLPTGSEITTSVDEALVAAPVTARRYMRERIDGPSPAPAPDGAALYERCAGCHKLGDYDASGAPDLAGKSGLIAGKLQAGHMGVSMTPTEASALAAWMADHASTQPPVPDPTPAPAPDGKAIYASRCAGCHKLGTYDASGSPDLAGKNGLIAGKLQAGHMGISLSAAEVSALAGWVATNTQAPIPDPTPAPAPNGKTLYDNRCAGCHKLDTYDASGSPDLAGKNSLIAGKLQAGHMGISLSAAEASALAAWTAENTPTPVPDPTPVPAPDGKATYDNRCAACHKLGTYDASGAPELAGKSGLVGAKTAGGHGGGPFAPDTLAALVAFVQANTPATNPDTPPAPPTYGNCTGCHGQPPTGTASPNSAGAHAAHRALPGIGSDCTACHRGASHNGFVDLAFPSAFNAKSVTAVDNGDGTCSNISCHGGKRTPDWWSGRIDVNSQCTSCHAAGTGQYNGYYSGEHRKHIVDKKLACSACHETGKLAVSHFTSLGTSAMEGPAGATIGGGTTRVSSYNRTTRSCATSCHENESW